MKKFLPLFIFFALIIEAENIDYGSKVFKVQSPAEIFIDTNNNFIFDETEPVKLPQIKYISENTNLSEYPILNTLTEEEKFFVTYKALETSQNLIKNRFVKLKNNDIIINNKSYTDEMLTSKFVFNDEASQKELVEKVKSINLDDYVILNLKNKKYHKLSCNLGRKSAKYKIIKLSELKETYSPCKSCHLTTHQAEKDYQNIPLQNFKNNTFKKENIEVFFLDLNKILKPDNTCKELACKTLRNAIDNAKTSIDFAIYGINNQPQILNALINAHKRGVKIRRVYDYSKKKYYEDNDKLDSIITDFKTDEVYDKTNEEALMHNKYFIFDKKRVFTGSSNISSTDLSGFNANYTLLINSEEVAKKYLNDFEQMYKGFFHKSKKPINSGFIKLSDTTKIKPLFSPQDNIINSEIIPLINSAKKYIYMPVFFITHKGIEEALINAKKRGIDIKIINDATNASAKYSVHKNLRANGIKVKTENYAGKMHAKTIIIDDEITVIGSMNFTKSGNSRNDENALIIQDTDITKYMRSTFEYLWNKIPAKYETYDVKAESLESIGSCFDGIDNDFDDKTDSADEGCFPKK